MKHLYIYISLFVLIAVPRAAWSQSSAQSDLELYRSQLSKNTNKEYAQRLDYLHQTTPPEKLMVDFAERGFDVLYDSISVFDWPDGIKIYPYEKRKALSVECYEVAKKLGSHRLKRMAEFLELDLLENRPEAEYERKMEGIEGIIRRCRKDGDKMMEAQCLQLMYYSSFYSEYKNYARSFVYLARLNDVLDEMGDEYPLKAVRFVNIGTSYFSFKDYDRAYRFLHKAMSWSPKKPIFGEIINKVSGLNYLAVYHHIKGELDSAAYYHRTILTYPGGEILDPIYSDIAICNMGYIEMERGNYDGAIAMIKAGAENMKGNAMGWDFIVGAYIALGECMIAKGDIPAAGKYIEQARDELKQFHGPMFGMKRVQALFALESKYYSHLGQYGKAKICLDSALIASEKYEEATGQHIILLGEQRLKEAEIERNKEQIANQRNIILFVLAILAIVSAGLALIVYLYRKKNAAYKALAIKAQEWASNPNEAPAPQPCKEITQEDRHIMSLLESEMQNYAYREAGLTAEMLADRLGVHRNALSHAINSTTGGNFNAYINGFRIKEAVRIISQTSRKDLYIDELYERVGFGSRSSFSRIFKQFTGLSPLEFQKQGGNNAKDTEF